MNSRLYLLLAISAILLSAGCIQEEFYHKVEKDGSSTLTVAFDFSQFVAQSAQYGSQYGAEGGLSVDEFEAQLEADCAAARQEHSDLTCAVNGTTLTMGIPIAADNPYYSLDVQDGFPYRTYRLTVTKIPTDRLSLGDSTSDILGSTGDQEVEPAQAIDLTNKAENAQTVQGMAFLSGFVFTYSVEMPAAIQSATAGAYAAEISEDNPNVATFDMMDVLADSEPLVVESQELNLLLLVAIAAVVLVVLLAVAFLVFGRR